MNVKVYLFLICAIFLISLASAFSTSKWDYDPFTAPNYSSIQNNTIVQVSGWYRNLTSHVVYAPDSLDKFCIGSGCITNPFYKFTLEGGANITGTTVLDNLAIFDVGNKIIVFGNSTSNITIDSKGNLKLNGEATQWDDMQASLSTAKTGTIRIPTWTVFKNGTYALAFADQDNANNQEEAFVALQMSHSYKLNTPIDCHIHWSCGTASTNNVTWGLEVTKSEIGSIFGNTNTYYVTQSCGSAYEHRLADFHSIGSFSSISGIVQMRIFRNSANTTDNYTGNDVFGLSIDCHYEKDSLGSDSEYVK